MKWGTIYSILISIKQGYPGGPHEYSHHIHRPSLPGGAGRSAYRRTACLHRRSRRGGRAGLPILRIRPGPGAGAGVPGGLPTDGAGQKAGGGGAGTQLRDLPHGRAPAMLQPLPVLLRGPDGPRVPGHPLLQGRRRPAQLPHGQLYHPHQPLPPGGPADHRPAHQPHQRLRPRCGPQAARHPAGQQGRGRESGGHAAVRAGGHRHERADRPLPRIQ